MLNPQVDLFRGDFAGPCEQVSDEHETACKTLIDYMARFCPLAFTERIRVQTQLLNSVEHLRVLRCRIKHRKKVIQSARTPEKQI